MTSTIVTRTLKLENCWIQDSIKRYERKKNPGDTKLLWRHQQYRWKYLDETNSTISKKVINNNWSESHKQLKSEWALIHFDNYYSLLHSLFVIFLCHWICLVEIFSAVSVMSSLKFRNASNVIFFISLSSLLQHLFPFFYLILCLIIF